MSLVERKRGISEAESVTKLTELAFFFIPLTFASSLFSMQVKELDSSTTSVAVFLAVAMAVTISSYTVRLVILSSTFLSLWRQWKDDIRAERGIRSSGPIATSAVLKWIWERRPWIIRCTDKVLHLARNQIIGYPSINGRDVTI